MEFLDRAKIVIGKKNSRSQAATAVKNSDPLSADISSSLTRALNNPLKTKSRTPDQDTQDLRQTLRAIEASFYLIDQIRDVIVEACHLVLRANAIDDLAGRALLAEQYDELRQSVQRLLDSAEEDAATLLAPDATGIVAKLNSVSSYTIFPARVDLAEGGLALPPPTEGFSETSEIADILGRLDSALDRLDSVSACYMKDAQYLMSKLGR